MQHSEQKRHYLLTCLSNYDFFYYRFIQIIASTSGNSSFIAGTIVAALFNSLVSGYPIFLLEVLIR